MADTQNITKIGDISSQLTKASRLVVNSDSFWIQTGGDANGKGQSVLIPAEFIRAYLMEAAKDYIDTQNDGKSATEVNIADGSISMEKTSFIFATNNDGLYLVDSNLNIGYTYSEGKDETHVVNGGDLSYIVLGTI